jgi:hypothetical protein
MGVPPLLVVTEIDALGAELPAWSIDPTEKENVVPEARPDTVTLVPETWLTCAPFWKTRYWIVQLGPAVDAFQLRVTLFDVTFEDARPVGTVGITVHPPDPEHAPMFVHG